MDAGAGQAWPDAEWWKHYGDDQLDALETKALEGSPSLDVASSRFGSAEKAIDIARAEAGVSIDGNVQYQRQRLSETGLIPPKFLGFTWYNQADLGVQFRYDFDFWGKQRAAIEAAVDEARAAEAERAAATLMLTTAIADAYFGWQADQARVALMEQLITTLERNLKIADLRVAHDIDSPDALYQARTRLAGAREQREAFAGSARIKKVAIAALLGVSPADLPELSRKTVARIRRRTSRQTSASIFSRAGPTSPPAAGASKPRCAAPTRRAPSSIRTSASARWSACRRSTWTSSSPPAAASSMSRRRCICRFSKVVVSKRAYGASKAQLDAAAAQYDSAVVSAAQDVATQALTAQQMQARRRERATQVDASQALQGPRPRARAAASATIAP